MSQVRDAVRGGGAGAGGIVSYPLGQLYQEVAFVAYHFHWSRDEVLDLAHPERRRWVEEIGRINEAMNEEEV